MRRLFSCAALAGLVLTSNPSSAEEASDDAARSNARQLASEASEAYRAAQYDLAYDRFNRAFKLVGVPALGVWSARSLERSGRLVEASERYREVLRVQLPADAPSGYAESLREARVELDELLPRIPNLILRLENAEGTEVEVTVNGRAVPAELFGVKQRVDPGRAVVRATRGLEVVTREVSLSERQVEEVTLTLSRPFAAETLASPPGSAREEESGSSLRTWGFVGLGAGGLLLAGGAITGLVALGQEGDLKDACGSDRVCPPSAQDDVSSFDTMRTLSSIGFIAGGVLAGAGVTLLLLDAGPSDERAPASPELSLFFTGSGAGLKGRF